MERFSSRRPYHSMAAAWRSCPVWSPDGSVIAFTGPVVAVSGPLLMVDPDGSPVEIPPIRVRVQTEHYRFLPGRAALVYVTIVSQAAPENF